MLEMEKGIKEMVSMSLDIRSFSEIEKEKNEQRNSIIEAARKIYMLTGDLRYEDLYMVIDRANEILKTKYDDPYLPDRLRIYGDTLHEFFPSKKSLLQEIDPLQIWGRQ